MVSATPGRVWILQKRIELWERKKRFLTPRGYSMSVIALVSCVKTKLDSANSARELFSGSALFRLSYAYAESLKPARILLLTTQYGLVLPEEPIDYYDRSPTNMDRDQWKAWATHVMQRLPQFADSRRDEFIFLTSVKYSDALRPFLSRAKTPLQGLRRGPRLHFLKVAAERAR